MGIQFWISGEPAVRYGHPNLVPYRTFTAADGSFALAIGNDAQFRVMCDIVGRPDWADDPRFARNQDRVVNRETIEGLISEVLINGRKAEWISTFRAAGIPCGPVRSVVEALSDPLAAAREVVTEIDHPTIGKMSMLGLSLRLNDTPPEIRRHPPLLGEHTEEILVGLGYDQADLKTMRESGVV